jgi:hypothetical protein
VKNCKIYVFPVSFERPPNLVASYDMHAKDQFFPDPERERERERSIINGTILSVLIKFINIMLFFVAILL